MAPKGEGGGGGGGGGGAAAEETLLPRRASPYTRCMSHAGDELRSFRSCLRWLCVDQSDPWSTAASWSLFLLLAVVVPVASHFLFSYSDSHRAASDAVIQLSLTSVAALSYLCLCSFVRRYGLRRFLFLDKLVGESERVRFGYTAQLSRSFHLLSYFVLPCFAAECGYKVWLYYSGMDRAPFLGSPVLSDVAACALELASWIYRTGIFFLVCVLFRLICHLQLLRLEDFAGAFQQGTDVAAVLKEHLRIRRQLHVISHRYRAFLITSLVLITISQFTALLLTTRPHAMTTFFNSGELALCSIGLVTGLCICFGSAAKITHKAQAITCHAATWHVCSTIESFETTAPEAPSPATTTVTRVYPLSDADDESGDEDELDDRKLIRSQVNTISYQKRQALVTYLENNMAGITVFGFVVDRTWLHMVFMIEFSLVLWLLGKTVGIS